MKDARTLGEIIKDAGGPAVIADASHGAIKKDAVYKWPDIGVPDRHWPILVSLADATPNELYAANLAARSQQKAAPTPAQGEAA